MIETHRIKGDSERAAGLDSLGLTSVVDDGLVVLHKSADVLCQELGGKPTS
jgi:hypothetical protein